MPFKHECCCVATACAVIVLCSNPLPQSIVERLIKRQALDYCEENSALFKNINSPFKEEITHQLQPISLVYFYPIIIKVEG